nr:hypothetical protein Iba_chr04bCG2440 [Ipomoea batatas]
MRKTNPEAEQWKEILAISVQSQGHHLNLQQLMTGMKNPLASAGVRGGRLQPEEPDEATSVIIESFSTRSSSAVNSKAANFDFLGLGLLRPFVLVIAVRSADRF